MNFVITFTLHIIQVYNHTFKIQNNEEAFAKGGPDSLQGP